eukprot:8971248-Heterocapsa_arctica.AAC.1
MRDDEELEFIKVIGKFPNNMVEAWNGPTRAASTTKDSKRIIYTGNIKEEGDWAARVTILMVKERLNHLTALVGLHS